MTVDEIVLGVTIALGMADLGACSAFDGDLNSQVTVEEVIAGINNALIGCTALPAASATPTASATPAASPTPDNVLFTGSISDLSPHQLGDELVFRVTLLDGTVRTDIERVAEVRSDGVFRTDTISFTQRTESKLHRDTGNELELIDSTDFDDEVQSFCMRPVLEISTPLLRGDVREDSTRCALRTIEGNRLLGTYIQSTRIIPIGVVPEITVPAGTYSNAIELQTDSNILNEQESSRVWLVPGIGAVRSELMNFGQVTKTRELIDGTIGGQSVRR